MPYQIFSSKSNSEHHVYHGDDCNLVDPVIHFKKDFIEIFTRLRILQNSNSLYSMRQRLDNMNKGRFLAKLDWEKEYKKVTNIILQPELTGLFQESKKKKQQNLIKAIRYHSDLFMALPIYAYQNHKMLFSRFTVDHLPKELDNKISPEFLRVDNDNMEYLGYTDMSKGEMKVAIEKRNYIISDFIGDETDWHCFFRTMASIKGTEKPHEGYPHLHYISSAWGISRKDVINQLLSYRYSLKAETVPFDPTIF
ncbi:MAG: hypothetical protein JWR38_1971 [Mucilaginibacter sp.]|nr:hypothetical protein [Mucilaginibacter sp.]